ncbi:MAG: GTPase HflX [Oligoflexales bacterium]|nr:GTPase HflX [Oligoflexales bacterium]
MKPHKRRAIDAYKTSLNSKSGRASNSPKKAILIGVQPSNINDEEMTRSISELKMLVSDLGHFVEAVFIQKQNQRIVANYLGTGKINEIALLTGGPGCIAKEANKPISRQTEIYKNDEYIVIANDELTSGQLRNLELMLAVDVIDRTGVILKIFEHRAHTRESKLEVEAARLEYEIARFRDNHSLGDKEGGGGRASRGDSNVELAKQRARERISVIRKKLLEINSEAEQIRQSDEIFRVALIGYTNVGKSTLMQLLTGSDVFIKDKLFATLETKIRRLSPPVNPPILVIDTVGFIDRLPHTLISSFKSTLAEARHSNLVLHVVDTADSLWHKQFELTENILCELGFKGAPKLLVFNKIDKVDELTRQNLAQQFPEAVQMNATDPSYGKLLRDKIIKFRETDLIEEELTIPYHKQHVISYFKDRIQIMDKRYGKYLVLVVRGSDIVLAQLKSRLLGK